jgi:hypothetical protein
MKKLLLNFWNFCRSIFLQILLLALAFRSWEEAQRLGSKKSSITSGYDGGAIAMGLIACICIYCIVWLQINKTKP